MLFLNRSLQITSIICALTALYVTAMNEQQMMEVLKSSITPEQRAWRQTQHDRYRITHPDRPLIRSEHRTAYSGKALYKSLSPALSTDPSDATPVTRVLVLANKTLYEDSIVKEKIDRYMHDFASGHGCMVELEVCEGGTAADIKDLLRSYYTDGGLDGAVQIGSFPVGWMEFKKDPFFGEYETWASDHYYMDLDGEWLDADHNGFFEKNNDGEGDRSPEIFYARIDVAPMGRFGTETDMLCSYLDKVHHYWSGDIPLNGTACELVEKDWADSRQYLERVYGKDNTDIFRYGTSQSVSRNDYLNNRLTESYTLLHLWCHASNYGHYFTNGGELDYKQVYNVKPKPVGYFHDGCSLADWTTADGKGYLGGAYIFNESPTALVCFSGTRSGQWIGNMGKEMFEELGKNTCIGKAYQIWFDKYIKRDMNNDPPYFMAWNYGYVILGDPMTTFVEPLTTKTRHETKPLTGDNGNFNYAVHASAKCINVTFSLPRSVPVTVQLYDLSGKRWLTRTKSAYSAGQQSLYLNTAGMSSGIYILQIHSGAYNDYRQVHIY